MEKPLFDMQDERCEHRTASYELRTKRGGLSNIYMKIYYDDAIPTVVRNCKLTGTDCISKYKFDCPRYANALLKQMADKGDENVI